MGPMNSIRRSVENCFEEREPESHSHIYEMINSDQKYIEKQTWYRLKEVLTIDYNKLIFYYQDY